MAKRWKRDIEVGKSIAVMLLVFRRICVVILVLYLPTRGITNPDKGKNKGK